MVKPKFRDLQGSYYSLPLKPPFSITNLSCRLFPLRANRNTVQSFCDNYVNILPPEIGHFRPCAPHVFLMMLDYGSLALEATNLGWFSQHEIMFCIPTEWYRVERGKWVFQDWAMLTPFIFVDDDLSLNMGRTVAGWPKTYASMTPTLSAWMKDPLAPVSEATASAMVFPELYAGKRQEQRVFLEIERTAPMSNMRLPFNTNSPVAPWSIAANAAKSMAGLQRDALGWMGGLGLLPTHDGSTPENYMAMMRNMAASMNPIRPNMNSSILNVKQFRASEDPNRYCYQAVTLGTMKFTKFNGIGLLGEQAVMLGDASGGYTVKLHEWPSIPITRLLGLEVEKRWRGDGVNVAELKPVMPYWYDSNMDYDTGYNVGWRSRDGIWHDRRGRLYQPQTIGTKVAPKELLYNSALGSNAKPIAGPFRFSGTSIRVMPLLAKRANLEAYLHDYLNAALEETNERFTLWASSTDSEEHGYVYMTATSFGDVTSETNNVGNWADRELAFLLPVKREREVAPGKWQVIGVGVVPAYTYVDNVAAAISGTEVLGIPTIGATFDDAESSWMSEEGPAKDAAQTLLLVNAEILPAVGEGERTQKRRIVEIMQGKPIEAADPLAWRITGDRWSAALRHELDRKYATKKESGDAMDNARAMGLQLLGNGVPFSVFTMKQFRDAEDPDFACYQSIVQIQRKLVEVLDLREIEEPLVIRMHDFPTQPLVKTLGLIGKPIRDDGVGIAYALQPIRPFWLRVAKEEELGKPLFYRAATATWTKAEPPESDPEDEHPERLKMPVSFFDDSAVMSTPRGAGTIQDKGDPRRLETTFDVQQMANGERVSAGTITLEEGRAAVEQIDPQMVIESILSREWGNWDDNTRWRKGRRDLEKRYTAQVSGVPADAMAFAELKFFDAIVGAIQGRGLEQTVIDRSEEMLKNFTAFQKHRAPMEERWSTLADWGVMRLYPELKPSGWLAPTNENIVGEIRGFLEAVAEISRLEVMGEPSSLEGRKDFAVRDNSTRLSEIVARALAELLRQFQKLAATPASPALRAAANSTSVADNKSAKGDPFQVVVDDAWNVWAMLRDAVALGRARYDLQRDALMSQLSKAWQKPDFCVRRDSAGPDMERLFPRGESVDDEWYVGAMRPDVHQSPTTSTSVTTRGKRPRKSR
ncbi:MAG: hypothetical protein JWL61_351 [Gemmatimonadetes bacterium]|nr:hypothetical protein [Gemmatimonadota bacterium]